MPVFGFEGVELDAAPKDAVPHCPECRRLLDRVWVKEQSVLGSGQRILMCPHCRVWLGYATTRK